MIDGYYAGYLMIEPCYSVLRRWKKLGGTLFDRKVLSWNRWPDLISELRDTEVIIPIPQRLSRSWKLGRSPSEVTAKSLSQAIDGAYARALHPLPRMPGARRQAQLALDQRIQNRIDFEVNERVVAALDRNASLLLVDDFMTSGHTLRSAARALRRRGFRRIRAFGLGVRPARNFDGRQ